MQLVNESRKITTERRNAGMYLSKGRVPTFLMLNSSCSQNLRPQSYQRHVHDVSRSFLMVVRGENEDERELKSKDPDSTVKIGLEGSRPKLI